MAIMGLLVAWLTLLTGSASAVTTCSLVPQLRDVSVSQGVGSYPVLVRGKQGLARFYLSLPSCASSSASIKVTGATLAVSSSATSVPAVMAYSPAASTTPPSLVPYAAAPALDSAADPKFVLPALVSASTAVRFGVTLSATINYSAQASSGATAVAGSTTFSTRPGTTTPIALTVEKKTNALRVLVVPMGDARKAYDTQFDATTKATTQNGMTALGRKLPVPDGTGDLTTTTSAGLRYTINPTLLDLSGLLDPSGLFCGRGTNFDKIKAQLAQFRLSWNTANPTKPADRVLGVVKDTLSGGGSASCAEGMAAINGPEAWVRADTSHSPSMTGSLMAMELGHTMGLVPATRADPYSPYHSAYVQADGTAPNRAYNVGLRSYLADDHTALTLSGTWNDTDTLFEKDDWTTLLCALGGATTTECALSGTVGSAVGVGAEPTFVLSGTTDDTADGTKVIESYHASGVPRTLPDASSSYRLVQLQGNQVVRDDGVPVTFATSAHSDIGSPAPTTGLFSAAMPFDTAANRIELRKGATVLYSRERGQRPTLTRTTSTSGGSSSGTPVVTRVSTKSDGTSVTGHSTISSDSVSADGKVVAFQSDATDLVPGDSNASTDVFVKHTDTGAVERVSVHEDGTQVSQGGYAPAVSADGRLVSFTSSDPSLDTANSFSFPQVYVRDLTNGHTYPMFGWDSGTYTGGFGGGGASGTSINSDGTVVSFSTNSNLVGNDTNGPDTFVRARASATATTGSNELVTVRPDGTPATAAPGGNDSYTVTSVSADGRYVAFGSEYSDLVSGDGNPSSDIFLRDRRAAVTSLLSKATDGGAANGASRNPQVTPDGHVVVFDSTATNLVTGLDGNGAGSDIFRLNTVTGSTTRISVGADGNQLDGYSYGASVSANGDFVTFQNVATSGVRDVYVWSRATDTTTKVTNQTVDWFVNDQPLDSGTVFFSQRNGTTAGDPDDVYQWVPAPPSTPAPGATVDVSVSATDDNPADLRLDLVYTCGSIGYPVAVGVQPTDTGTTSASWSLKADTSLACQGGTLSAVVSDGFSQAAPLAAGEMTSGSTAKSPVAAISGPAVGATLLQFDPLTLGGSGKDPENGELTGSSLAWTVLGADGVTVASGSGSIVDVAPPPRGWSPGTYTVRLQASDGDGTTDRATSTFVVVGDADHDTLSVTAEGPGTCFPAGADSDPTNAYADQDGDGIPNADDVTLTGKPCAAATTYSAYVTVSPDPIPLTGTSGRVITATVRLPYRDLTSVAPGSVRAQIAGQDVTSSLGNLGWSVAGSTATAKFDRGVLVRYLSSRNLLNRPVTLTVSGKASSGAWSFSGIGSLSTK